MLFDSYITEIGGDGKCIIFWVLKVIRNIHLSWVTICLNIDSVIFKSYFNFTGCDVKFIVTVKN